VIIAVVKQIIQKRNAIQQYTKEKSLNFKDLQTNFWFFRRYSIIIVISMLVFSLGLFMYLIWLCFSYIQHTSITITILQSSFHFIIGAIALFIDKFNLISGLDKNNGLTSKITNTLEILQKDGKVEKDENPNFENLPSPIKIKLVFEIDENPREEVIVINADWINHWNWKRLLKTIILSLKKKQSTQRWKRRFL